MKQLLCIILCVHYCGRSYSLMWKGVSKTIEGVALGVVGVDNLADGGIFLSSVTQVYISANS